MTLPSVDVESRNALEKGVLGLAHRLSSVRDTQEIMDIVRHGARELLDADGVTFVLRDGNQCYYAEEDAISPLWKGMRFPMTSCISGWAMLNHQAVVIEDIYKDPRIPHDAYRLTFVHSLVMVPVRQEDPIGAIGAYWRENRRPRPEEVKILETIANAAAVAFTNVGLIHSLHVMVEELQKRNKELDLAYRAKASFLSTISHELRTPLNIILGFSQAIEQQVLGPIEQKNYVTYGEHIHDAGKNLLQLINDILEVAALDNVSHFLNVESVNFPAMMQSVIHLFENKIKEKRITIQNDLSDYLPPLKGDARLIKQIFFHILSNSIKFNPEEGKITISAFQTDKEIRIAFTDTGIGMSDEEIEKAMMPFQQADGRLERRFEGAGLGLALCKGYVDLHKGELNITSTLGKGTTVAITLPL